MHLNYSAKDLWNVFSSGDHSHTSATQTSSLNLIWLQTTFIILNILNLNCGCLNGVFSIGMNSYICSVKKSV